VLLLDVHEGMRVLQEEIFGPVLPIVPYDTLDQAIAFVNARDKPLALYWFGRNTAHRDQVLAHTQSGGVSTNDTLVHLAQDSLPFGGVGPSGQGHYHGEWGFRRFSHEKPVFQQSRGSGGWLVCPPYTPRLQRLVQWLLSK
jgi:coniferyl-aldehyde dehydrogenase